MDHIDLTADDHDSPVTSLLDLPNELLAAIASSPNCSPSTLRLVCHRLAAVAAPAAWRSIALPRDPDSQDQLLATLIDPTQLRQGLIHSLHLRVPDTAESSFSIHSWSTALKLLPNLSRLHVTGTSPHTSIPPQLHSVIILLKNLTTFRCEQIGLTHCARFTEWAPSVRVFEGRDLRGYNVIFFTEEGTPGGVLDTRLERVVIERTASSPESRARGLVYTLAAAATTLKSLEYRGGELVVEPFSAGLYTTLDFSNLALRTLSVLGLTDVFCLAPTTTQRALVALLAPLLPLTELRLSVEGQSFSVRESFARKLVLPNLATLHLETTGPGRSAVQRDMLDGAAFVDLATLLSPLSFPALKTLRLRGWFQASTCALIASVPVGDAFNVFDTTGLDPPSTRKPPSTSAQPARQRFHILG
ncbi:hypothetical protein RQP46_002581 [Phenoliferia psychrophenolica]